MTFDVELAAAPLDTAWLALDDNAARRRAGAPRRVARDARPLQLDGRIQRVAPGDRGLRQHVTLHRRARLAAGELAGDGAASVTSSA